jgi:hypothetical protein
MIVHKADNLELQKPVVSPSCVLMHYCRAEIAVQYRYPEFNCAMHIWRNLLMLKCAG